MGLFWTDFALEKVQSLDSQETTDTSTPTPALPPPPPPGGHVTLCV